ncbi:MAG: hypothetical protein Q9197_000958 [Variospora fuerteventurae]
MPGTTYQIRDGVDGHAQPLGEREDCERVQQLLGIPLIRLTYPTLDRGHWLLYNVTKGQTYRCPKHTMAEGCTLRVNYPRIVLNATGLDLHHVRLDVRETSTGQQGMKLQGSSRIFDSIQ